MAEPLLRLLQTECVGHPGSYPLLHGASDMKQSRIGSKRGRGAGRLRMEDLARRVGVSIATVHRTLHKPEKVSEDTRRRVQQAIAETGYVQNLVAGSLASNRTNVIAAIVPSLSNLVYGTTVHALNEVLRKSGFHLLLGTVGFSTTEEESLIATLLGRRPDGMFLHGCTHTPETQRLLQNAGIPVVETGDLPKRPLDMVVSYSNFEAGKAMTNHLLDKGYRRIAFVSASIRENERHFHRLRGYRAALRAREIAFNPARVLQVPMGFHQGAEGLLALLDRDIGVDAVFFASDVFALGTHSSAYAGDGRFLRRSPSRALATRSLRES